MMANDRVCQRCGKTFSGGRFSHFCEDCLKQIKSESTYKERICVDCGRSFMGYPKSKRCPDCQHRRTLEANRRRNKTGTKRPLGSIDKCAVCGKEYVVNSGGQKYCPACAETGLKMWEKENKPKAARMRYGDRKIREKEMIANQKKICRYCLAEFSTSTKNKQYCSEYCKKMSRDINSAIYKQKIGKRNDISSLYKKREEYRDKKRKEVSG